MLKKSIESLLSWKNLSRLCLYVSAAICVYNPDFTALAVIQALLL